VLASAVRPTLGPAGRNVLLQRPLHRSPLATKDGVTVAEEIELSDRFANMGAALVIEGAAKTSLAAGDGTTTAIVLARALCREGARLIAAGHHPIELNRGIDLAVEHIREALARMSKTVRGNKDVQRVATLSASGDGAIGEVVARAIDQVGGEGIVHIEQGQALATDLILAEGTEVSRGYLSAYFITDPERLVAVLDQPAILLNEKKISRVEELAPILEKVMAVGRSLLVMSEVEGDALSMLVVNKMKGVLNVCAIQPPSYGERRKEMLRDLAAQTGGRAFIDESGLRLVDATLADLGHAAQVIVDQEKTTIVGGKIRKDEVEARAGEIRARHEASRSEFDRQQLEERLRKLVGGAALIRVGGTTLPEVREKKLRFEDALFAARAAIEEGIVPGGGVALLRAVGGLPKLEKRLSPERSAGVALVRRACEEPCRQIADNAGRHGATVIDKIRSGNATFGYDAAKDRFCDLVKAGVVDPRKVVRLALENAVSIAKLLLMTEAFIVDAPRAAVDYPLHGSSRDALSLDPFLSKR